MQIKINREENAARKLFIMAIIAFRIDSSGRMTQNPLDAYRKAFDSHEPPP